MHPKDREGIANSVDPDQTAPLGAVWSGSALFAQTYLSENLGSLRYVRVGLSVTVGLNHVKLQQWQPMIRETLSGFFNLRNIGPFIFFVYGI